MIRDYKKINAKEQMNPVKPCLVIIMFLMTSLVFPQKAVETQVSDAAVKFAATFGGDGDDKGESVQQTADGGYVITENTTSYSTPANPLIYLIKTDSNGNQNWYKIFGGNGENEGNSIQQTKDRGYIIAGSTKACGAGGWDVYLIKADSSGDCVWTRTFGGNNDDYGYSVQQTKDGGYIVVGSTNSFGTGGVDIYLIKTDSNGDCVWTRTFGGSGSDEGRSVQQTRDGGYIIAGTTNSYSPGYNEIYLIKTDRNGDGMWTRTLGGSGDSYGYSVQQTTDNGYIVAGSTSSSLAGNNDVCLIKIDNNGNQNWYKTYGGKNSDEGYSMQQTNDEGYIVAGSTHSYGAGNADVYLVKTDSDGKQKWHKTFGGSKDDIGRSVQQTKDGGYIITGYTESYRAGGWDVYLIKTDSNGNINKKFKK